MSAPLGLTGFVGLTGRVGLTAFVGLVELLDLTFPNRSKTCGCSVCGPESNEHAHFNQIQIVRINTTMQTHMTMLVSGAQKPTEHAGICFK